MNFINIGKQRTTITFESVHHHDNKKNNDDNNNLIIIVSGVVLSALLLTGGLVFAGLRQRGSADIVVNSPPQGLDNKGVDA